MTPSLPRDFMRWLGPWYLGEESWVENFDSADWLAGRVPAKYVSQRRWFRPYLEVSHCGTSGCCESFMLHFGPTIGDVKPIVEDEEG